MILFFFVWSTYHHVVGFIIGKYWKLLFNFFLKKNLGPQWILKLGPQWTLIISRARKTLNRGEVVTTGKSKKCSTRALLNFGSRAFVDFFLKKKWLNFLKIILFFSSSKFEPTNSILASFLLNHRGRCVEEARNNNYNKFMVLFF